MIGDNLSSHSSVEVIRKYEQNNILFVFLPPSSTPILQPLDVSFFCPLKRSWRKILEDKKRSCHGRPCNLAKDTFPLLLRRLYKEVYSNAASNIKASFEKCGLLPLNVEKLLAVLPQVATGDNTPESNLSSTSAMDDSLISVVQGMRYGDASKSKVSRAKKLNDEPGKSVELADFPSTSSDRNLEEESEGNNKEDHEVNELDDSRYFVGIFVKFVYESECFPGRIISTNESGCVIKSMTRSGFNWRWPQHEDIMHYPFPDIKIKIAPPVPKKRGVFSVSELDDAWGFKMR